MNALILGGASSVWDDYIRLTEMVGPWTGTIICVNAAGCWWPYRMEHWVTAHPERMAYWQRVRRDNGYSSRWGPAQPGEVPDYTVWTCADRILALDWVDQVTEHNWNGSSGLLAETIAKLELRTRRSVLCGVPMDPRPHFDHSGKWVSAEGEGGFQRKWEFHQEKIIGHCRSMSGWTRDLLGEPTAEWLVA